MINPYIDINPYICVCMDLQAHTNTRQRRWESLVMKLVASLCLELLENQDCLTEKENKQTKS